MKKKLLVDVAIVAIVMVVLSLTVAASGVLVSSQTVQMSGVIASTNVGIYSNSLCTQSLTSIDWGAITLGASVTRTIYVKNTGTTSITLSMSNTNWNPAIANGPLSLVWNRENTILAPQGITTATLTLSTASAINGITTFSVDIVLSGTE